MIEIKQLLDAETITQYTYYVDKNERKVFVGDFVLHHRVRGLVDYASGNLVIRFEHFVISLDEFCRYDIEIIGNVFDNPYLKF
mgnify:CR=1 FL=1